MAAAVRLRYGRGELLAKVGWGGPDCCNEWEFIEDERRIQRSLTPRALLPGRRNKTTPAHYAGGQTNLGLHGSGAEGAIDLRPYHLLSQSLKSSGHDATLR